MHASIATSMHETDVLLGIVLRSVSTAATNATKAGHGDPQGARSVRDSKGESVGNLQPVQCEIVEVIDLVDAVAHRTTPAARFSNPDCK